MYLYVDLHLNGDRRVQGILKGYDPFMNIVLDEAYHIKSKDETLSQIDEILNKYSNNGEKPSKAILRQVQDIIYTERTVPEKIPDWFYKLSKSSNEDRTDNIIKSIKAKF